MALHAYMTDAGLNALTRVMASRGPLVFTKAELGDGVCTGQDACRARTSLVNHTVDATLVDVRYEAGEAKVSARYENRGLLKGFFVNEIGVYVEDPDTGEDVLYCYETYAEGGPDEDVRPDWIAPESSAVYRRVYEVATIVSNVETVEIKFMPPDMASREMLESAVADLRDEMGASEDLLSKRMDQGDARLADQIAGAQKDFNAKVDGLSQRIDGKSDVNHRHANAAQSSDGFLSAQDKKKLDGVDEGANRYVLPAATRTTRGGVRVGEGLKLSGDVLSAELDEAEMRAIAKSAASEVSVNLNRAMSELEGRLSERDSQLAAADNQLRGDTDQADAALRTRIAEMEAGIADAVDQSYVNAAVRKSALETRTELQGVINDLRAQLQERIDERAARDELSDYLRVTDAEAMTDSEIDAILGEVSA